MSQTKIKKLSRHSLAFLSASFLLAGCGSTAVSSAPHIMTTAHHTIHLSINIDYNDHSLWAFDGYSNGQMTITVPTGYTVIAQVHNKTGLAQAFGIYHGHHLAFPHAGMSYANVKTNPNAGLSPQQSQTFRFVANHPGHFIVANFLGQGTRLHPRNGQWIQFNVQTHVKPQVIVK